MDRLVRLIIRPKQTPLARPERFHSGVIKRFREGGPYRMEAALWTGERGSGRMITSEHETEQAALDAALDVYRDYPNDQEDATIFFGGYDQID